MLAEVDMQSRLICAIKYLSVVEVRQLYFFDWAGDSAILSLKNFFIKENSAFGL